MLVAHVQGDPGEVALQARWRLGTTASKVDLKLARAILPVALWHLVVAKIRPVAIHFTHDREKIVKVVVCIGEGLVCLVAKLPTTLLPARMLPAYRLCRHGVFDLNALGPLQVFPGLVATAGQIHLLFTVERAPTVLIYHVIAVDPHDLALGFLKCVGIVRFSTHTGGIN